MCYAQDFLETWSRCDLIVGASSKVPIKRGAIEAIGVATPIGKGIEKKIKQEKVKQAELEEGAEGFKDPRACRDPESCGNFQES